MDLWFGGLCRRTGGHGRGLRVGGARKGDQASIDARRAGRSAAKAVAAAFPGLGKSYVVAVLMAPVVIGAAQDLGVSAHTFAVALAGRLLGFCQQPIADAEIIMSVPMKQRNASSGVQTIGSPRVLNEVLKEMGRTPGK